MSCKPLLARLALLCAVPLVGGGLALGDVPLRETGGVGKAYRPTVRDQGIDGTWEVVFANKGGEKAPDEFLKGIRLTFRKGRLRVEVAGEVLDATYDLNPWTTPMTIDIRASGQVSAGICAFRRGNLTLCYGEPGLPRPVAFTAPNGSDYLVMVLRRVKR